MIIPEEYTLSVEPLGDIYNTEMARILHKACGIVIYQVQDGQLTQEAVDNAIAQHICASNS